MTKLYLSEKGRITHYHEAWADEEQIIEHSGRVGTRGRTRMHPRNARVAEATEVRRLLQPARALGYKALRQERHRTLLVEYKVKGMGSLRDIEKRYRLEERLNNLLGWTGLGHCDGGSIGSGTMEVCCFVVDFEIARKVISRDLKGSKYGNFTRIFDEDAG